MNIDDDSNIHPDENINISSFDLHNQLNIFAIHMNEDMIRQNLHLQNKITDLKNELSTSKRDNSQVSTNLQKVTNSLHLLTKRFIKEMRSFNSYTDCVNEGFDKQERKIMRLKEKNERLINDKIRLEKHNRLLRSVLELD